MLNQDSINSNSTKNFPLLEEALKQGLGTLSKTGVFVVDTRPNTGRSVKERFVVRDASTEETVNWGDVNQAFDEAKSKVFFERLEKKLAEAPKTFKGQGFVGGLQAEVTSTSPYHIHFFQTMFRQMEHTLLTKQVAPHIQQKIKIYHLPWGKVSDLGLEHPYEKLILVDFQNYRVGIVGTAYAGEIKKSAFTMCNYFLPSVEILPMHSSANCLPDGSNASVLFGLSGTGKTTLSASPDRALIGDDEIIWSHNGLSNLEGGCYAKLIDLDPSKEPVIYKAVNTPGAMMENIVLKQNGEPDFFDGSKTENTRASYPISYIENVFDQTKESQHPKTVVFLMADAFGAMPALARLNEWQLQYHFISGYTAKLAGTELGVKEPQAAFSACFGAPFMPRHPSVYAEALAKKVKEHKCEVWILNTGWQEGGYGKSERYPISVSRTLLTAIQNGVLSNVPMQKHPVFGFEIPLEAKGVDSKFLKIPNLDAAKQLAEKFKNNMKKYEKVVSREVLEKGGPV